MSEVNKEVLKTAVANVVSIMAKSMPNSFYDAGHIIQPYFILLEGSGDKPKKKSSIDVNDIHRELEWMIRRGDISAKFSWLDPKAVEEKEKRIKEIEAQHYDEKSSGGAL